MMNISRLIEKGLLTIKREGLSSFCFKTLRYLYHKVLGRALVVERFKIPKRPEVERWYRGNKRKVTIVIPSYNQTKLVKKCVNSILNQESGKDVAIVIVDDGSPKKVQGYLKDLEAENVRVILKKKNEGFAKTVNRGIKGVTKGDVVLLNNDIEARPLWLEALQHFAYKTPGAGIMGPKLLYPDGTIQSAGSFRNFNAPQWFDHYYRRKPTNFPPVNIPREVIAVTGAAMYIKREVIKKIGLLDEKFEMAGEDVDYCLRARDAGFRVFYCPYSVLTHYEGYSRGEGKSPREIRSAKYVWKKWGKRFDNRDVFDRKGRVKVIYVLPDTGVGGGNRVVFEHLNGLKERGFNVSLYTKWGKPEWFDLKVPVKVFEDYSNLEKALAKEKAIKVATWWETADIVWRASLINGIPVYFVQDIESSYYVEDPIMQARALASYRAEFFYLTTSGWNRDRLQETHYHPAVVSPAIDLKTFKPDPEVKRRDDMLLAVGRDHPIKNLEMTVLGWKKMANKPKLYLFGAEPYLKRQYGAAEYVYKPSDEDVAGLYNQATVFVQTSRHEGFCLTVLEAMACGCPVVTTNADGNMDFCVDGKNCLIVRQDDDDQLARVLERLFSDFNLRKQLSEEGLKTARTYSWDKKNDELVKFYHRVAKKKSFIGGKI